jgi:hypothetical protein
MRRQIPGGIHRLAYGKSTIDYEVVYSARRTLAISVYPDGSVLVKAPEGAFFGSIEETVQRRAGWILKQRRRFEGLERPYTPHREYVSGEAYCFLGRQCRLKVVESQVERVVRSRGMLTVETRTPQDGAHVGELVERWFAHQAERVFTQRLEACSLRITHWLVEKPRLVIRPMKARWGSMTAKGTLTLNPILIQAPTELIDYVILHELCHLREMSHSAAFYALIDQVMPAWREHRQKLNTFHFV